MSAMSVSAVEAINVWFGYKRNVDALRDLNLNIEQGQIYALLGPNGCGKTTLLRIILGRLRPQNGFVAVFGRRPSSASDCAIGYMPQEIALFDEMTIKETLNYFGTLYAMNCKVILERISHLTQVLRLRESETRIGHLSSGQKRLISMAAAMVHSPRLLILDEPTVGVDSILRHQVWMYLQELSQRDRVSIILTTHYMEEAKNASVVGFLRSGRMLVEDNPSQMMCQYNCKRLEDVFVVLSKQDDELGHRKNRLQSQRPDKKTNEKMKADGTPYKPSFSCNRVKALLSKLYLRVVRNPMMIWGFYLMPILQVINVAFTIGANPRNMDIAIVNEDVLSNHSRLYIDEIDDHFVHKNYLDDKESAVQSVINGQNWMAVHIAHNFSDAFQRRFLTKGHVSEEDLEYSQIRLTVDASNRIIFQSIERYLLQAFQRFLIDFGRNIGKNPLLFTSPIDTQKPIYGQMELSATDYVAAGTTIAILHALTLVGAAFLVMIERRTGYTERDFVAGVTPLEMLLTYTIFASIAISIQYILTMVFSYLIMGLSLEGKAIDVFILLMSEGLQGMSFGLLFALLFKTEFLLIALIMGFTIPLWVCSGMFWPVESYEWQTFMLISLYNPMTKPIDTLRSICIRGWSIWHEKAVGGLVVSFTYTVILAIVNHIILCTHKNRATF